MKVVLFCGGQGMRLREYSEKVPKPMVPIGYRPILWHVMKYYAHFGHKDFILCLGYQGDVIKDYFVNYKEYVSNDFVLKGGSTNLLNRDIDGWNITFVDTGVTSNVAERLLAIKPFVENEEFFFANYSDGLTDLNLPVMVDRFRSMDKAALIMTAKPTRSFQVATINEEDNTVTGMNSLSDIKRLWINAGYFIFNKKVFDYIDTSDDLPVRTFPNLAEANELAAHPHDGIFLTMDTFNEKEALDKMYEKGDTPWQLWKVNQQAESSDYGTKTNKRRK